MKNQYIGDIGDYGKYSLLRAFSNGGVKIGVNWYLTEDDGSNDGKFTDYLKRKDEFRRYDPDLFDALKKLAGRKSKSVQDIEKYDLIHNAIFYSELLNPKGRPSDREEERRKWFENSIEALNDVELIFLDPDNGLLENGNASKPGAEKYVLKEEVKKYFMAGHNVVYYCHKGRRSLSQWFDYKSRMFNMIPKAMPAVLTFHKGSQRSYIFLIHEKDFEKYRAIIDEVKNRWFQVFTEEYTDKGDAVGNTSNETITLKRSSGDAVTISKRAMDSWQ